MRRGLPQMLVLKRLPEGNNAGETDTDIERWENEGGATGQQQKRGLAKSIRFQSAYMRK